MSIDATKYVAHAEKKLDNAVKATFQLISTWKTCARTLYGWISEILRVFIGKHRTGIEESRYVANVSFALFTLIGAAALIDLLPMIELGMSFLPFRYIRWFLV